MNKSAAILIVDDYPLTRTHVRQVLAELGFVNVFEADNGRSAQDLMQRQPIDVVIGDWGMPVMSGIDLLQWMRGSQRYAKTPFMMLTAEANPASVRAALQPGVNAYMIKPFTVHGFASKFLGMIGPLAEAPGAGTSAAAHAPQPLSPALPESNVIGLEQPLAERLKKCTVLIVDDVPTNIEMLAGALKDEYAIKVAIDGKTALEIANALPVDLVLLDIMMPVLDGFEVCRQLKANPNTAHIPIIFLSERDGVEDVVGGLRLGAVDFVSKPADPTILKARVAAHLALATAMHDLKRQNALLVENAHLREDVARMTQHDLKSPLAATLHASQSLLDTDLDQRQYASVLMIETAASKALEMINLTLDLYKMETGEYQLVLQAFDLGAMLAKVALQTEIAFASRGISVRYAMPDTMTCLGEPALCYSLFNNVFKNAAEAAPDTSSITVELAPAEGKVSVAIANQGEVPASMHGRFFDKYTRAGKVGGSGLGTYSIRLMAEIQGGAVAMETGNGRTRLTVTLPANC